ncbi:MAG: hypothetical protein V3R99_11645 [Thermoguttaceae bacterium]
MKFGSPRTPRCRDGSAHRIGPVDGPVAPVDAAPGQFAIDPNRSGDNVPTLAGTGKSWWGIAIGLAVLIHLAADLALTVSAWHFSDVALLFAAAVPFSQASLVALLAAALRMPLYARFVVAATGICAVWFVTISLLPNTSMTGAQSASWATGLATQAAVIMAAVAARSLPRHLFAAISANADESSRRRFQFGVGSLLIWITLVAVLLGVGRTAAAQLDWNHAVTEWQHFYFGPVLGTFNAVYALLVVFSLSGRRRTIAHAFIAGLTIATLSCFQPLVLMLLFGETGGLERTPTLILAGTQTALLYATLLPVRMSRRDND